jgi:hypothetical protein
LIILFSDGEKKRAKIFLNRQLIFQESATSSTEDETRKIIASCKEWVKMNTNNKIYEGPWQKPGK